MSDDLESALQGKSLDDGWVIRGKRVRSSCATGACHAVGFVAENADGRKAFVKVMEPTPDPTLDGLE